MGESVGESVGGKSPEVQKIANANEKMGKKFKSKSRGNGPKFWYPLNKDDSQNQFQLKKKRSQKKWKITKFSLEIKFIHTLEQQYRPDLDDVRNDEASRHDYISNGLQENYHFLSCW